MPTHAFTIRKLADAAGVGVEAVRYYQRGGLLAAPDRVAVPKVAEGAQTRTTGMLHRRCLL